MERFYHYVLAFSILYSISILESAGKNIVENAGDDQCSLLVRRYISPEDLKILDDYFTKNPKAVDEFNDIMTSKTKSKRDVEAEVRCFGDNGRLVNMIAKIFSFDMTPESSEAVRTRFFYSSRKMKQVEVTLGNKSNINSIDFNPKRKTVVVVHGFISHSGAGWVKDMIRAYLEWEDVNVFAVDWSARSYTFKYWKAVANTRTVGENIANFMKELQKSFGLDVKKCHFIGHSLGAQIVSFASQKLGLVARITGLDPASYCFYTTSLKDKIDPSDADFVDVIHTNANGFGYPDSAGHVDFYPNGGVQQPGCRAELRGLLKVFTPCNVLVAAICNHGRSYEYFTESMTNSKCKFLGSPWNLTANGLNATMASKYCNEKNAQCPEMGINATRKIPGSFLTITKDEVPYCVSKWWQQVPSSHLQQDIIRELNQLKPKNKYFFQTWYEKFVPSKITKYLG